MILDIPKNKKWFHSPTAYNTVACILWKLGDNVVCQSGWSKAGQGEAIAPSVGKNIIIVIEVNCTIYRYIDQSPNTICVSSSKYFHHSSRSSPRVPPSPRSLSAAPSTQHKCSPVARRRPNCCQSPARGLRGTSGRCQTSWRSPWWRRRSIRARSPWSWIPPATAAPWGNPWTSGPCLGRWTWASSLAAPAPACVTPTRSPSSSAACRAWRRRAARTTWKSSRLVSDYKVVQVINHPAEACQRVSLTDFFTETFCKTVREGCLRGIK